MSEFDFSGKAVNTGARFTDEAGSGMRTVAYNGTAGQFIVEVKGIDDAQVQAFIAETGADWFADGALSVSELTVVPLTGVVSAVVDKTTGAPFKKGTKFNKDVMTTLKRIAVLIPAFPGEIFTFSGRGQGKAYNFQASPRWKNSWGVFTRDNGEPMLGLEPRINSILEQVANGSALPAHYAIRVVLKPVSAKNAVVLGNKATSKYRPFDVVGGRVNTPEEVAEIEDILDDIATWWTEQTNWASGENAPAAPVAVVVAEDDDNPFA